MVVVDGYDFEFVGGDEGVDDMGAYIARSSRDNYTLGGGVRG